jgi:hypothetical protein
MRCISAAPQSLPSCARCAGIAHSTRPGATSLSIASHLPVTLASYCITPVILPPGRGEKRACNYFQRSKAGIEAVFNVTAMERSILVELFERGGRDQLSGLRDRRPIERLVNKGFVERHTLNSQQEEYVLTAIGKKVLDNK